MKEVAIVTDSSTYLPKDLAEDLGLHVLPLMLHWDDKSYLDGVDIEAEEFYEKLSWSNRFAHGESPCSRSSKWLTGI